MTFTAMETGHQTRTYNLDVSTGRYTPISPEGMSGRFVSSNGEWLMAGDANRHGLLNLRTGAFVNAEVEPADRPAGWSADGSAVFLFQSGQQSARIYRLAVPSGARTLAATLEPGDPAGLLAVGNVVVAGDGTHFAYNTSRQFSQLFMIDFGK
jgi:hypothetical protein